MQKIVIDEEFKSLLPALDARTYAALEENLLTHGCRDSLILWGDILIDGHNRYEICTKHNIPFDTTQKEFPSREDVLIWIITNQVSRRNLSPIQLSYFRGMHYKAEKKLQGTSNQHSKKSESCQNGTFHKKTSASIAEQYRVSPRTITRDSHIAAAISAIGLISPTAQGKILSGEVSIDKTVLEKLASKPSDELKAITGEIEEGIYGKRSKSQSTQESTDENANGGNTGVGNAAQVEHYQNYNTVADLTEDFCINLRNLIQNGSIAEIKSAFAAYISLLEELLAPTAAQG